MTAEDNFPPEVMALGAGRAALEVQLQALQFWVELRGKVYASAGDYSAEHTYIDFIGFCVTKFTKSLGAIVTLLDSGFPEDAGILTRSAYESYLAIAAVSADPQLTDDFVFKPIGKHAGRLVHPVATSGKPIWRTLVDSETGEEFSSGVSIARLSEVTGYPADAQLHPVVYGFLSEHVHTNMLASGAYRTLDETAYSISQYGGLLQYTFWATYVGAIVIDLFSGFDGEDDRLEAAWNEAKAGSLEALRELLSVMQVSDGFERVPELMSARLGLKASRA